MNHNQQKVCFGTLALGKNYCSLARELAKDLAKYSPTTPLVVLTDRPQDFNTYKNVLAYKHQQQSIGCYHDKRFVIAKGLSEFDVCIFIDADMRILEPVTQSLEWQPGITSHTVWTNIYKHNKNQFEIRLLEQMTNKLKLDLSEISFVHECLFVVTKDSGKELEFLKIWDKIAPYFELNGFYRGEGHSIGIAAAKSGLEIHKNSMKEITFFKDKIVLQKIKTQEEDLEKTKVYFELQKTLEYPQKNLAKKIIDKSGKIIRHIWLSFQLKITTLKDFNFYYR